MQYCKTCQHPAIAEIEQLLAQRRSALSLSKQFDLSYDSITRHIRQGHALESLQNAVASPSATIGPQDPLQATPKSLAPLAPMLYRAERLLKGAEQHFRKARKTDDLKAVNGSIQATTKALELVAKLMGLLDHRPSVEVNVSVEQHQAMAAHENAMSMSERELADIAVAQLRAQVMGGDAYAASQVIALAHAIPEAEVHAT